MQYLKVYIAENKIFKSPNEYWFNDELFLSSKNFKTKHCYLLDINKSVLGYIAVSEKNDIYSSPIFGTFAGFDCVQNLTFEEKDYFIKSVLALFNSNNFSLKMPPDFLLSDDFGWNQNLINNGFVIKYTELNFHIELSNFNISMIHKSALRRLKKCELAGFIFEEWQNPSIEFCYQFITKARFRKGFPMSMSLEKFIEMFIVYSDRYFVFRILNTQNETIALSVVVKINEEILYNFYPADDENYLHFSPSVMLHLGIIEYAKSNNYLFFDLGIATDKGIRNEGLITFKKHLGAIEGFKQEYLLKLK